MPRSSKGDAIKWTFGYQVRGNVYSHTASNLYPTMARAARAMGLLAVSYEQAKTPVCVWLVCVHETSKAQANV